MEKVVSRRERRKLSKELMCMRCVVRLLGKYYVDSKAFLLISFRMVALEAKTLRA